ncbi:Cation/H(+) antiporter 15 [Linum grandiflorum]
MPVPKEPTEITWQNETVCYAFPTRTTTGGLSFSAPFTVALALLNFQVLLIFVISNSLNFFLRRVGIPSFVGQALTGVILGPTLLGRTEYFRNEVFPHNSQDLLEIVAFVGYANFMFLVGVKMDVSTVMNSGKKVITIGLAAMILPMVLGLAAQHSKINNAESKFVVAQIFTVTGIQSLTTFAVVSQLLSELKLTNSEIGRFALSASLVTGTSTTTKLEISRK